MEEWLKAIGTLAGGIGALIASIAKLIEIIKKTTLRIPTRNLSNRLKDTVERLLPFLSLLYL